jgi:hypothetical protein
VKPSQPVDSIEGVASVTCFESMCNFLNYLFTCAIAFLFGSTEETEKSVIPVSEIGKSSSEKVEKVLMEPVVPSQIESLLESTEKKPLEEKVAIYPDQTLDAILDNTKGFPKFINDGSNRKQVFFGRYQFAIKPTELFHLDGSSASLEELDQQGGLSRHDHISEDLLIKKDHHDPMTRKQNTLIVADFPGVESPKSITFFLYRPEGKDSGSLFIQAKRSPLAMPSSFSAQIEKLKKEQEEKELKMIEVDEEEMRNLVLYDDSEWIVAEKKEETNTLERYKTHQSVINFKKLDDHDFASMEVNVEYGVLQLTIKPLA